MVRYVIALLISITFITTLVIALYTVPHKEKTKTVISVKEIVLNKDKYIDREATVRGLLISKVSDETKLLFVIFIHSIVGGKAISVPIFVFEKYNVYELADVNNTKYVILLATEKNLDKKLGQIVVVTGKVIQVEERETKTKMLAMIVR